MIISALNDNNDLGFRFSLDIFQPVGLFPFLPSSSNLMSLAAWMPSSLRFFSICLLRAREALSSALMAQPMMIACSGVRRASLLETGEPQPHHHSSSHRWPESHQEPLRASTAGPLRAKMALVAAEPEVSAALAPDHSSRRHPTLPFPTSGGSRGSGKQQGSM